MRVWRWLGRLIPHWEDPMGSLAVCCGYWITYFECLPRWDDTEPPHHQSAIELPIGHPERLTGSELSPAEKQLWAELDGIGW